MMMMKEVEEVFLTTMRLIPTPALSHVMVVTP